MSISYELFDAIRSFDNLRRINRDEYLQWLKAHEAYKGSQGYSKERAAAEAKRKNADGTARKVAAEKVNGCLQRMYDNLSKVALVAPSADQVAILQVLSMKTNVTRQELERAARSMNGNSLALSALNDIADKHFPKLGSKTTDPNKRFHDNYMKYAQDLSGESAERILREIKAGAAEILRSPVKQSIIEQAEVRKNIHGVQYHIDDLPQRDELVSERQFYNDFVPADQYDNFMKVVNDK